jgi:hypothetical protein
MMIDKKECDRPILVARMWLLLLLDASERAGIAPLSVERLHRLVYLANALAPVYNLVVPDGYILKYRRGPFFPLVHWDVGRLVAQGLVLAAGSRPIKDKLGYWVSANYSLSKSGMASVDGALMLETVAPKATYLQEVALAFAALEGPQRDAATLTDVNYDSAIEETPVYFGDDEQNLSPFAAEAVVEAGAPSVRRLKLHRYFQYLETTWTRRQDKSRAS